MTSPSPSLGMTIGGPYQMLPYMAKAVEDKGFAAVWVAETHQSAIIQASVAAQATERIRVGTNIALAFPTAPAAQAMMAWDIGELSNNRFTLGLGSQVRRIIEDRFSVGFRPAAARMAEYIQALHAAWAFHRGDDDPTFEGEHYHVKHPGVTGGGAGRNAEITVPVYLAAVGPLMVAAAATYADGLLGHPFTSDRYIEQTVHERIGEALQAANRPREDFTLAQGIMISIDDDRQVARERAKQQIAFYGTTPNYKPVFETYGDGHLIDELRAVFAKDRKNVEALRAAVPEEAVDRYAVAGTPDEVRDRFAEIQHLADHWIVGGPWYRMSMEELASSAMAALETLAPTADATSDRV